jgi:dTDP-4-amino-4,6-dideoxygalactose transaminase
MMSGSQRNVAMVDLRAAYRVQGNEIDAAIRRVMQSGWYILGKEGATFEREFASWNGVSHVIGVANGTDAIIVALRGLGIGAGDTVFTVSHTAVATVAAVELAGAIPMLVDIDRHTYTIDPQKLEEAVRAVKTAGGRPRAVVAVHLYGHPCDVGAIGEICRVHDMVLIEDCAQAHGAMVEGRKVGSFGAAASFSFYPTKNLGAFGDGGAVATNDRALADRCTAIRQYGWRERYLSDIAGMNSRLDELQAAILAVRLKRLDAETAARRAVAQRYDEALKGAIATPTIRPGTTHAYHLYVVRSARRDALAIALKARGVDTGIHYPAPVHLQKAYAGRTAIAPSGMAETERACREVLSLPMHAFLSDEDVEHVTESVNETT